MIFIINYVILFYSLLNGVEWHKSGSVWLQNHPKSVGKVVIQREYEAS